MENILPKIWYENLEILDISFQPILNMHTGKIFGVEALVRNYEEIGFRSIESLFDTVYREDILYSFDMELREKAIVKFKQIEIYKDLKLFYNLDNRLFEMQNFSPGNTSKILKEHDLKKDSICFEISDKYRISDKHDMHTLIEHYKDNNFCIAIDDYGVDYSGYRLLHDVEPDILKIDRFFLADIQNNPKKKIMLRNMVHLAIQLGIQVIAEGIETKEEYFICRDVGCHLFQGFLAQRPTTNVESITTHYQPIEEIIANEKRMSGDNYEIKNYIKKIQTLYVKTKMEAVIEYFQIHQDDSVVPVVNSLSEPLGILQDTQIKDFLYSPYGRALLLNNGSQKSKLKNLMKPCGIADINSDISVIIELFSNNPESIGIIITQNSQYYGFLSARAIITIMNEQNLLYAREQNPLTKLPGNTMIEKYLASTSSSESTFLLSYFDLDNFKAFNDVYGFRNGDRVIQLFADILRKNLPQEYFKAHIGGDDFFIAMEIKKYDEDECALQIQELIKKFTDDVKEFYSQEDKDRGYILSKDRSEQEKTFPLLTVSASIVIVHENTKKRCLQSINKVLSMQKKVAKSATNHISMSCLL